jgi:hypothetical protein
LLGLHEFIERPRYILPDFFGNVGKIPLSGALQPLLPNTDGVVPQPDKPAQGHKNDYR